MASSVDVLVIGAGPAGSTIARLLASWDYSVLMLQGPGFRHPFGAALPSGIDDVFETIGIRRAVESAGFRRSTGRTIWWPGRESEDDPPGRYGYHVERREFDALLVELARAAGVQIQRNSRAPRVALRLGAVEHDTGVSSARFVVDCTGRAGLMARQIKRYWDPCHRTMGLSTILRSSSGNWDAPPDHSLTEAFENGWAWSVPLAADRRYVCLMTDQGEIRTSPDVAFRTMLETTKNFRRLFESAEMEETPWTRDASLYYADQYAGPNWLLAGDAGSFTDPVSSFGVRKALVSAWTGAVVANTCLSTPNLVDPAIEYYNSRESGWYTDRALQAARYFSEGRRIFGGGFWRRRSSPAECSLSFLERPLDRMRTRLLDAQQLRFRLTTSVDVEPCAAIRDTRIVVTDRAVLRGLDRMEMLFGVDLAGLAELAPEFSTLEMLFAEYSRRYDAATFDDVVEALAFLMARGALVLD